MVSASSNSAYVHAQSAHLDRGKAIGRGAIAHPAIDIVTPALGAAGSAIVVVGMIVLKTITTINDIRATVLAQGSIAFIVAPPENVCCPECAPACPIKIL